MVSAADENFVLAKSNVSKAASSMNVGYDMYAVVGPMARTLADVAMMQNILYGPHLLDNASIRPKYETGPSLPEGDLR